MLRCFAATGTIACGPNYLLRREFDRTPTNTAMLSRQFRLDGDVPQNGALL